MKPALVLDLNETLVFSSDILPAAAPTMCLLEQTTSKIKKKPSRFINSKLRKKQID